MELKKVADGRLVEEASFTGARDLARIRSEKKRRQSFLRELTGSIAIIVTGAKKGAALAQNKSGRDFKNVGRYLIKNLFEAAGIPMKKLLAQGYRVCRIGKDGALEGAPLIR